MAKILSLKDLRRHPSRSKREPPYKAPTHLQEKTKEWFLSVVNEFELSAHHVRLLTLAAESWDRCEQARKAIKKRGLVYNDRFNRPRIRPEVGVERDSRIAFARLLRELALDVSTPDDEPRPPAIKGR